MVFRAVTNSMAKNTAASKPGWRRMNETTRFSKDCERCREFYHHRTARTPGSDNLRPLLGTPDFADVGDFGDRLLAFHRAGIEEQCLILDAVHTNLEFVD